MELFVDIADLEMIKAVDEYYPIDGFTTNPKILAKASQPVQELMPEYKNFVEEKKLKVFFQVTADKAEEMLKQAKALQAYFGEHLVIKLPAIKEGFKAIGLCKREGIAVCVTVIHSTMQALVAARAGADYVAPYISHIDNLGADGVRCVEEMITAFQSGGYPCKVLGASFRTVDQIKRLAIVGCHAVTITPEMFDSLIEHPSTDKCMAGFDAAWKETFGDRQIDDMVS